MVEDVNLIENLINKNELDRRRIYLFDEINDASAFNIIMQMNYHIEHTNESNKDYPISLIINSNGGSIVDFYAILHSIQSAQNSGIKVATIVTGAAYSAAAAILAFGSKGLRFAYPNASVMFHPVSWGLGPDYAQFQESSNEFLKRDTERFLDLVMKQLGLDTKELKKFKKDVEKSVWMDANQAKKCGFVDEIISKPHGEILKKAANLG